MRNRLSFLVIALCLLSSGMEAQTYMAPEVTVSSEKVKKDGIIYYSHVVIEKQTLYSISKAYGVSVQEIYNANPELNIKENGLKNGSVILIPVANVQSVKAEAVSLPAGAPEEATTPTTEETAQPVMEVASQPVREQTATTMPDDSQDYFYYTVKWYEDLSIVASKHNMTKEVIMAFNGMTSPKLGKRQQLKIPVHPESVDTSILYNIPDNDSTAQSQPAGVQNDTPAADSTSLQSRIDDFATRIGDRIESIFRDDTPVDNVTVSIVLPLTHKDDISSSNYDFYCGALLAVKDLADEGISTDLNVFDIGKGFSGISGNLTKSDIVIGPVSCPDIDSTFNFIDEGTPLVSPLDPRAVKFADGNANFIHTPSSADAQYQEIVRWIRRDMRSEDRLILIKEENGKVSDLARYLEESGLTFSTVSYGILMSAKIDSKFESLMNMDGNNRFVIASDSEAFVNDAVRNINLMVHRKYNVTLYAPSKIKNFDTIEVEHLHNANLHMASSYFVDYEQSRIKNFLLRYRALFNAEPTPFAYQGYDSVYYLLRSYCKNPSNWTEDLVANKHQGLQSDFQFERKENGGLFNTAVRKVIYHPDFSIELTD